MTFCYTLFTFLWMVVSSWRFKLVAYVGLVGLGLFAMPGPTLLLMLLLVLPYMLFLASRKSGRLDVGRFLIVACMAAVFACAFAVLGETLFPVRLEQAMSGNDPSFFYRVRGPALAGIAIMEQYPFAGAGLTGEPFIETGVTNIYLRSSGYSAGWAVRLAGHRAPDQLFLAALDLSRGDLGRRHGCRADVLAARPGRAQSCLRLDGLGHPGTGFGCLCRPDLLGGALPRRRRRRAASATGYRRTQQNHRAGAAGPSG